MYAIKKNSAHKQLHPNLLPCSIQHDGKVPISRRYWSTELQHGVKTAYFRGRKLAGREVRLPKGYRGVVLRTTSEKLAVRPSDPANGQVDMAQSRQPDVKILSHEASFDCMTVWGHEAVPGADDEHIRAIQELITFAESLHSSTGVVAKT